jgi:hypothetical protein
VSSQIGAGFLSRGKVISVCCALSVETVLYLRDSHTRLPRFDAGHKHGKQTNEFAAHEHLLAAAARNRYPAWEKCIFLTVSGEGKKQITTLFGVVTESLEPPFSVEEEALFRNM